MSKRSAVAALAITSLLLSACAPTTDAGEGTAAEPGFAASVAPPRESPTQRRTAESAEEPVPDRSEEAGPSEGEVQAEEPAPPALDSAPPAEVIPAVEVAAPVEAAIETPAPAPAPAPRPAPAPAQAPAPAPAPGVSDAPVEPIEPLPVGPNDPFVPPPHGEPNPLAGNPGVPPGPPPPGPVTDENISAAHPQPGYPGPSVAIPPGLLRIGGSGYAPGELISVVFSVPNSDDNFLNHGPGATTGPVVVYADHNGSYTFDIRIGPELVPGHYAVMTWEPLRAGDAAEASKRFLRVLVS